MTENGKEEVEAPSPRPSLVKNPEGNSSVIKEITKEFFDQSTIHGVKYIATRPLHEKVWWLIVCIVSIFICVFQIQTLYTKWKETPVVITIDEKFTSIGEIPFPAVTICGHFTIENETQLSYERIMLEKPFDQMESYLLDMFEIASGLCFDTLKNSHRRNMSSLFKVRNSSFHDTIEKMFNANVGQFLEKCKGIESLGSWPCNRGFVKVLTKNGLCLSFNMVRKEELVKENVTLYLEDSFNDTFGWNPETGYASKIPVIEKDEKYAFPHRIFTVGRTLQVLVKHYDGYANNCLNPIRVYIHHPHDFPWDADNSLLYSYPFPYGLDSIGVTPEMLMTPLHLRKSIPADRRNCVFDNERQLMFFKIYSKSNCELECLTNITLNECKCVMYWMPHLNGTPICGIKQHKCYTLLAFRYLSVNIASTSADIINQYDIPYKCNCVQRCNSVTYKIEKKSPESQKNMINEDKEEDDEDQEYSMPISLGRNRIAPMSETKLKQPSVVPIMYPPFFFNASANEFHLSSIQGSIPSTDFNVSEEEYPTSFTPAQFIPFMNSYAFEDENPDSETEIPELPVFEPFVDKQFSRYFNFRIEFQKAQILAYKRVAPYEISDFIANCGGLLGLFMGISVLSLVEILYFYTFRFVDAVRNVRKQKVENGLEEK